MYKVQAPAANRQLMGPSPKSVSIEPAPALDSDMISLGQAYPRPAGRPGREALLEALWQDVSGPNGVQTPLSRRVQRLVVELAINDPQLTAGRIAAKFRLTESRVFNFQMRVRQRLAKLSPFEELHDRLKLQMQYFLMTSRNRGVADLTKRFRVSAECAERFIWMHGNASGPDARLAVLREISAGVNSRLTEQQRETIFRYAIDAPKIGTVRLARVISVQPELVRTFRRAMGLLVGNGVVRHVRKQHTYRVPDAEPMPTEPCWENAPRRKRSPRRPPATADPFMRTLSNIVAPYDGATFDESLLLDASNYEIIEKASTRHRSDKVESLIFLE